MRGTELQEDGKYEGREGTGGVEDRRMEGQEDERMGGAFGLGIIDHELKHY